MFLKRLKFSRTSELQIKFDVSDGTYISIPNNRKFSNRNRENDFSKKFETCSERFSIVYYIERALKQLMFIDFADPASLL